MKEYLSRLPIEIKDLIGTARDISSQNNIPAYLVGGFVRDIMLGVKNLDLDIVVEGNGIKFAEDLASKLKAGVVSHRRFGTATVMVRRDLKIDVASARSETYPKPAALPVVSPGTLKNDLFRRDFTINAMAISIMSENFGKVIDYFGGKDDLAAKRVRILHNRSFIDDPTRIFRAIRFETRYDFSIEPGTLRRLKAAVRLKMLERVSPQRIREDFILMLEENDPLGQIKRLKKLAGLKFINKSLKATEKTYALIKSAENQVGLFRSDYPERRILDDWLVYFMALIDSLDLKKTKEVLKKFSFARGEEKRILTCKKVNKEFALSLSSTDIVPSKIFALLEPLSYEVILLLSAKYPSHHIQKHVKDFFEIYNGMRIYTRGADLHRLGLAPGPKYQRIFSKVLEAKLDGVVKTRKEELALIRNLINQKH